MTYYYFLKSILITQLILLLFTPIKAQIQMDDWQLNMTQARNQIKYEGIPNTALSVEVSIQNFKRKLQPQKQEIQIPTPNGQFETFVIEPTTVIAPEITHLYTIKTFKGYQKNDPTVLIACDISDNGFHAGVYAANDSYFIEPRTIKTNQIKHHSVYFKRELSVGQVQCKVKHAARRVAPTPFRHQREIAVAKRTFRLAIVATGEFGQQFGGTPYSATNVLNALASGVNLINPIYLRDVGVDFMLVSDASMVFENPNTDPINTNNENSIFNNIYDLAVDAVGLNGFDLGHAVIWADLGGLASPGVCDDFYKVEGYSASDASVTTLWVDYVAHEIGHQFNADHNFASSECGTSVNNFRYEPGEGSSIMAYAGVCEPVARYASGSDPYFHYASINTMNAYILSLGCGSTTNTGNNSNPVANAQSNITIPKQTPFVLVGTATDANDNDANLTYNWEQYDGATSPTTGSPDCSSTNAPLFRFRPPNSTGIRSFPQYSDVLAGNNNSIAWEKLPCVARDLNFSLIVRDNNTSFGRVDNDLMKVTVANTGPFEVTAPNGGETLTGNETSTITWSVNGTNAHCTNVDILLSTDGGATFTVIANATPNDGMEEVMIPNTASTAARVLIQCDVAGGYGNTSTFYDVSNANFTVEEGIGSSCDDDLVEADFDDPITSDDYEAANMITADKKLAVASTVNFYAGTSITLKSGFEIPSGTQFLAKIQACASLQVTETAAINSTIEETNVIATSPLNNSILTVSEWKIQIFPNPVNEQLTLVTQVGTSLRYRLISLSGQTIEEGEFNNTVQIGINHVHQGMYLLELVDISSGVHHFEKIIVKQR